MNKLSLLPLLLSYYHKPQEAKNRGQHLECFSRKLMIYCIAFARQSHHQGTQGGVVGPKHSVCNKANSHFLKEMYQTDSS